MQVSNIQYKQDFAYNVQVVRMLNKKLSTPDFLVNFLLMLLKIHTYKSREVKFIFDFQYFLYCALLL